MEGEDVMIACSKEEKVYEFDVLKAVKLWVELGDEDGDEVFKK